MTRLRLCRRNLAVSRESLVFVDTDFYRSTFFFHNVIKKDSKASLQAPGLRRDTVRMFADG